MTPSRPAATLDPRTWLLWGLAASLPALLGRNPLPLAAALIAALGVRAAWSAATPALAAWAGLVRLAALFAAVGALFNLATAHLGDRVLFTLPPGWPIVGGAWTLNALVYGLLGGLALLTLVVVGTTVGALLDWAALLRLLPGRLSGLAVAGSVAIAFVPQTAAAFRQIREAQAARGARFRGARDLPPLLVPLLATGLERAIILAEALEARGFGAPLGPARAEPWRGSLTVLGLTAAVTGGYLLADNRGPIALAALAAGGLALFVAGREGSRPRRNRYRPARWQRRDWLVAAAAVVAILATLLAASRDPAALAYEPYPSLAAPRVDLPLLLALDLLLAPALLAPPEASA